MSRKMLLLTVPVLAAVTALALLVSDTVWANILAAGDVPTVMTYQGFLQNSSGEPISGTVNLEFSIYDQGSGGNEVWSETHSGVSVVDGIFTVLLGSNGQPLTAEVFSSESRYIEVTVDGGSPLPRQRIASVPYALRAQYAKSSESATTAITATYAYSLLNGINGIDKEGYAYVKIVAKSGGDYTTINDALNNSVTPSPTERYLILVMPGIYTERVESQEYVHIMGLGGPHLTRITSETESNNFNSADAATFVLPANSLLSNISVYNTGNAQNSTAIFVANGNEYTELTDVHAFATASGGDRHIGIYVSGGKAKLTRVHVEASGATFAEGFNRAVTTHSGSPTIDSSTLLGNSLGANASAYGLYLNGGSADITNSYIRGSDVGTGAAYGIENNGNGRVRADHSIIIGDDLGLRLAQSASIGQIGASRLEGGATAFTSTNLRCAQSYDENYTELVQNTCAPPAP